MHAFSVGLRSYGIQYHPEWNAATVRRQVESGTTQLQAAGERPDAVLADTQRLGSQGERLARRFFDAVSVLLMPADRLNKGIVKDLHH